MDLNLLTKKLRSLQIPLPLTPEGREKDEAERIRRSAKSRRHRGGEDRKDICRRKGRTNEERKEKRGWRTGEKVRKMARKG